MQTDEIDRVIAELTKAQRALVLASEPDHITGKEGCGTDIYGPLYRVAKALHKKGIGSYTHGSFYADMYWNCPLGLAIRNRLMETRDAG